MVNLSITHTENYNAVISIDGKQIKTLSQSFDESGCRSGSMGEFTINKDLYYANLEECRKQEDKFKEDMRKIEDERMVSNEAQE